MVPIARVSIATNPLYLRSISLFAREIAVAAGLSEDATRKLELAAEEAGLLIIDQAFEGSPNGRFEMSCEHVDGGFVLAFEDMGLPFDWSMASKSESSRHSVSLLSSFADELRMINRGKQGKRLEFIVNEAREAIEQDAYNDGAAELPGEEVPLAPLDVPLELRPADPARDGLAFARCMHRVYGYSYVETVYFPDRIRGLIEQGRLMSFVAVTDEGEVVGHQGVKIESLDSRVANICMGAVDPRYRGRRLFERLKGMAVDALRERGMLGVQVEAVALHPFSQRANFKTGARETGMLLAIVSRGAQFRSIANGELDDDVRHSAVLYYNPVNPAPRREVYLPVRHQAMAARIYAWVNLDRTIHPAGEETAMPLPEAAQIAIEVVQAVGQATITLIAPGQDLALLVRDQLNQMKLARMDVIYIDIPLGHPAAPVQVEVAEKLGFSFCGIYPEKHREGDLLRLHYLNNLRIDRSQIVVINEMGEALLDYALSELARVAG